MPSTDANGITIEYERTGPVGAEAVLLVAGLGGQLHSWPPPIVEGLAAAGFDVIRMDNRDSGRSERLNGRRSYLQEIVTALGEGREAPTEVPYLLADMADDCAGVLTALGIDTAHVIGVSMGGMIAQTLAARHPERVRSLTSIMSTTGAPDVGGATPEMRRLLFTPPPTDRAGWTRFGIELARLGWADHFDEHRARQEAERDFDRGIYPEGTGRQLAAVLASGDRTSEIAAISAPTLVIHGDVDPLIAVSGGAATAAAIRDAELFVLPGVGHDLPPPYLPDVLDRVLDHLRSA